MAFYAGLDDATKADLATIMKNPEGSLSVKYLGVPLISTRLSAAECDVLKDKILGRNKGWTNKSLTYGGRAQFTQSILFQVFWTSIFVLPQRILKDIERLLCDHSYSLVWN